MAKHELRDPTGNLLGTLEPERDNSWSSSSADVDPRPNWLRRMEALLQLPWALWWAFGIPYASVWTGASLYGDSNLLHILNDDDTWNWLLYFPAVNFLYSLWIGKQIGHHFIIPFCGILAATVLIGISWSYYTVKAFKPKLSRFGFVIDPSARDTIKKLKAAESKRDKSANLFFKKNDPVIRDILQDYMKARRLRAKITCERSRWDAKWSACDSSVGFDLEVVAATGYSSETTIRVGKVSTSEAFQIQQALSGAVAR